AGHGRSDRGRPSRPSGHGERRGGRADRDRVQAAHDPDRARGTRAEPRPAARDGVAGPARHPDPHRGHARAAAAAEAREGGRSHRDRARRRVSLPASRREAPLARVKLATRLFLTTSLLAALAVAGLAVAADRPLPGYLEDEIAHGLEGGGALQAPLLPAESRRGP